MGATTAFKASTLLPLNVPVGKPLLSCNATDLLQAQINLNGHFYDCLRSSITVSCPTLNDKNQEVDECRGETLECDVRMTGGTQSVTCTNGTLISNHPIVCKSATLMENKNILNCVFQRFDENTQNTPRTPVPTVRQPSPTIISRIPTTSRPILSVAPLTPAPVTEEHNSLETLDQRGSESENQEVEHELQPQVKSAIKNIFPHDLLIAPSTMYLPSKMYLPPKAQLQTDFGEDLKERMRGIFPSDLFALSHSKASETNANEVNNNTPGLSERVQESTNWRDQAQSQWNIKTNTNNNDLSGMKTKTSNTPTRFGGTGTEQNLHDRLIFTS